VTYSGSSGSRLLIACFAEGTDEPSAERSEPDAKKQRKHTDEKAVTEREALEEGGGEKTKRATKAKAEFDGRQVGGNEYP